jgi:hypothetical protein
MKTAAAGNAEDASATHYLIAATSSIRTPTLAALRRIAYNGAVLLPSTKVKGG